MNPGPFVRKTILVLCYATALLLFSPTLNAQQTSSLIRYVDPFIGTGAHGHTYPGATVPFGMVQLSPDNGDEGWDWCSGYHYSSHTIAGFSHTHLSGTGAGDWCDISVMPSLGLIPDTGRFYKIGFSHSHEQASPGYYSVLLDNGIRASLTATERCGLHEYVFPVGGAAPVIRFDLGFHINKDHPVRTHLWRLNDSTIVGYRYSTGWEQNQHVFFAARTSIPFSRVVFSQAEVPPGADSATATQLRAQLVFKTHPSRILLKVALSNTDIHKALKALEEIAHWDFADVRKKAAEKWEKELRKAEIYTADERLKRIYYTALYHTCLAPVLYSDADGEYVNAKDERHRMSGEGKEPQRYTVYSLWDTFRALHPLFTVLQPDRLPDILNSLLAFHDENGLLPVWDLGTNETGSMTGYHSIPVLADAILKNVKDIDVKKAYRAMLQSADQPIRGTPDYIKYGYLPQDKAGSSVTISLEYAYDDWCIAQVAKKLNDEALYKTFMRRSGAYKLLFDSATGFIRARNSDGSRIEPFDPCLVQHGRETQYREGNAWQYSFFVPHDVRGLATLYGGDKAFIQKLDTLFSTNAPVVGDDAAEPDVTGLIGQYAHGNEPAHHIAYLYSFVGAPWKTQEKVRLIIDSLYHDAPDGYAGNEDCGQMSAWAVWSILGLYPANPAAGRYVFGSPMTDSAVLRLPDHKTLTIRTRGNSGDHPYIRAVSWNHHPYSRCYIDHAQLMQGGLLEFEMGPSPDSTWGARPQDRP
jgi:predicted alpha-1,2-mannosidase